MCVLQGASGKADQRGGAGLLLRSVSTNYGVTFKRAEGPSRLQGWTGSMCVVLTQLSVAACNPVTYATLCLTCLKIMKEDIFKQYGMLNHLKMLICGSNGAKIFF